MPASIVVVGAGILGCTAALLAADRGHSVRVLDRAAHPWSGASASGEGKVHLGLIYALGDASTQRHILEGALSFSRVLDRAADTRLPWSDLTGEPFLNVVMPSSMLSADDLAERYRELDERFQQSDLADGASYLGQPLERLHEPGLVTEHLTGLPALRVSERTIETTRLRRLLVDRILQHPLIELTLGREVLALHDLPDAVDVQHRDAADPQATIRKEHADVVLNCSWESQSALHADAEAPPLSFRYKAALSIPLDVIDPTTCRTMTFVIGPFGDVARRANDVYVSWYPSGRVVHEHGIAPSVEARALVASLDAAHPTVGEQLDALAAVGALPHLDAAARRRVSLSGGWILAEGSSDIDARDSGLHERRDGLIAQRGRVLSPRNWKLSTAPLAAQRSVDAVESLLTGDVLA